MATAILNLELERSNQAREINMLDLIFQKTGARWLFDTVLMTITISQLLVAFLVAAFIFITF